MSNYWRLMPRPESTPASLASFTPTGGDLFADMQGTNVMSCSQRIPRSVSHVKRREQWQHWTELVPKRQLQNYWRLLPRPESTPAALAAFTPTGGDLFSDMQGTSRLESMAKGEGLQEYLAHKKPPFLGPYSMHTHRALWRS